MLSQPICIKGVGLHTGQEVTLHILPAEEGFGIKFRRTDIKDAELISADVNHVVTTKRGTTLKVNNASVATVEHLLSALFSLGIEDALIELDGGEIPILDGSAKPFLDAIEKAVYWKVNQIKILLFLKDHLPTWMKKLVVNIL